MPSLNDLLRQTMLGTAAGAGTSVTPLRPDSIVAPRLNSWVGAADQPIWRYDWSAYDRITNLTCLTRSMNYMQMPVCDAIAWGPVTVGVFGVVHPLQLTSGFLIRSDYLAEGHIPGSDSGTWPLEAKTDQSFQHVFGYEIQLITGQIRPIPREAWDKPTFMPETAGASPTVPANAGQVATIGLAPVRILLVVSFVCCKERPDFEPKGILGAGRLYPLLMVMANAPLDAVEADIRVSRPAQTPHPEMDGEAMGQDIRASFFTDNNAGSGLPLRWPDFFSYYLIDPPPGSYVAVDPARPARRITGAVEACGTKFHALTAAPEGMLLPDAAMETKPHDVPFDKVAGQGEFDNVHIAPRMIAPENVRAEHPGEPSLASIAMAPFCVHDCLHTHWRWGTGTDAKHVRGWSGTQPYATPGAPLVPPNQKITMELTSPHAFRYHAEVKAPIPAGQWQVIYHHGSAYALEVRTSGALAKLGLQIGPSVLLRDEIPMAVRSGEGFGWAMLYWHLRYRHDELGVQERIRVTNAAKARA